MTYLPFDKTLKPARARFPEGACDCHFHIFDHASTYPLASTAAYTPTPATEQDYRALCKAYGIDRAVLVHPSVYGADHASYEAIMAANSDWMRGVAVAFPHTTDEQIKRWDQLGTKGSRINILFDHGPTRQDIDTIIDKVKPYGWHIQLFADLTKSADMALYIAERGMSVVVDHIGHSEPEHLMKSPEFTNLLSLMREGRAWIKLSAPYRLSTQAPGYPEVRPLVDTIMDNSPAQAVWGTDWPHPHIKQGGMPNDGDLADLVFDWLPDAASRQAVLVDNPTRLYWSD